MSFIRVVLKQSVSKSVSKKQIKRTKMMVTVTKQNSMAEVKDSFRHGKTALKIQTNKEAKEYFGQVYVDYNEY